MPTTAPTSGWSAVVQVSSPSRYSIVPGPGGSVLLQWSPDNINWTSLTDEPVSTLFSGSLPIAALYVRGMSFRSQGTFDAVFSPADSYPGALAPARVASAMTASTPQNTLVVMGDSRMGNYGPTILGNQYNTNKYGQLCTILEMLGQRFTLVQNISVGGTTIAGMLTSQVPQVAVLRPRYVMAQSGYNGFVGGVTAQTAIAQFRQCVETITGLGITFIAFTDIPGNTLTTQQQIQQQIFNSWIRTLPTLYDNVIVIDSYSAVCGTVADGTLGRMLSTLNDDGVHVNCNGSYAIAREAYAVLDPIIPKAQAFSRSSGNWAQMIPNPSMEGNNPSGTNRWTASTGVTGNGPNDGVGVCFNSATATTSMVQRSASALAAAYGQNNRTGQLFNIAFSSPSADGVFLYSPTQQFINCELRGWAPGVQRFVGQRIIPSVANGFNYVPTLATNSAFSGATEPVWPTIYGATVVDGGLTLITVAAINAGVPMYAVAEVYMGSLVGSVGAYISLSFQDVTGATINTVTGSFFDASSGGTPNYAPGFSVLTTPVFTIPQGTVFIAANFALKGAASSSVVAQLGNFEIRAVGL